MSHRLFWMSLAAAVVIALPGVVFGHAELVTSDPADGSTISTPFTLEATFAEEIDPERSTLFVENSSGAQVATGTVNADDPTMMTAELPALPDGVYTVRWTTVTPDDNGIERGTFTFNVGGVPATVTPVPTQGPGEPTGSSNDALLAIALAAVLIVAVVALVIIRGRR